MKHKAKNKHPRAKIDPEFDKEVIRLRKQGNTIKQIEEKLHAGQMRVNNTITRLIEIHKLNDLHYVNFNRLFSTTDSRKHDTSISHIFLSSYLCIFYCYFIHS